MPAEALGIGGRVVKNILQTRLGFNVLLLLHSAILSA